MAKIGIDLIVNTAEAIKNIEAFSSKTSKSIDGIVSGFKSIAAFSFAGVGFEKLIESGIEAQDALDRMSAALRLVGSSTPVSAFEDLASEIQDLIGVSDELVLEQAALLKTLGATNAQVESVITVAADLSSVFKQDLSVSVNELAQTFSGVLPRALSKAIPELKNLSDEQLRAGAAIDIVNQRIGGFSKELQGSTNVQLKIAKERIGDFVEEIGKLIVNSPATAGALKIFNDGLKSITESLKLLPDGLALLINDFKKLLVILGGNIFGNTRKDLQELDNVEKEILKGFSDKLKDVDSSGKKASTTLGKLKDNAVGLGKAFRDIAKEIANLQSIAKLEFFKTNEKGQLEFTLSGEAFQGFNNFLKGLNEEGKKLGQSAREGIVLGASLAAVVLKGKEGAKQLAGTVVQTIGNAYLPGLGDALKQVLDVFANGAKFVRDQITNFFKEIPEIAINTFESGLEFIPAINDAIPLMIEKLAERLPELTPKIVDAMIKGFILGLPRFFIEMIKIIPKFLEALVVGLIQAVKEAFSVVGNLFGIGGGGGSGIFGGGGFLGLGFADGGNVPGFGIKDSVPAMLTPGELVVDRSTVSKLSSFLDRFENDSRTTGFNAQSDQGTLQSQNLNINLQIGEKELANVLLNLDRNGFRTAL